MNWKKRYEIQIITDAKQIAIGDLINWSHSESPKKIAGYAVIGRIDEERTLYGSYKRLKEEAIKYTGTDYGCLSIGDNTVILRLIKRNVKGE